MIGEIGGAVEGEAVIRQGRDIFLAAGCDYGADAAQAFAIDLAEEIEFVAAASRFAREECHEKRLAVDARHGTVTKTERSLG
ncbi:MAG: hypothetical protein PVSMB1_19490 [Gemmatimonadaceae bacterium]